MRDGTYHRAKTSDVRLRGDVLGKRAPSGLRDKGEVPVLGMSLVPWKSDQEAPWPSQSSVRALPFIPVGQRQWGRPPKGRSSCPSGAKGTRQGPGTSGGDNPEREDAGLD